jgi:hypothetical protein
MGKIPEVLLGTENQRLISSIARQPFQIRHKFPKELDRITVLPDHGSFLLMAVPMQQFREHRIPKTTKEIKARINRAFRIVQ